ncbi:MAG: DNA polymerase III subunit delta [Stenotrophobium sp.]
MQLKTSQLASHLARGLAPLYVVAGEEPLLIQETLDAIRARARKDGYSEREVLDADRYFDWQRLAEVCASLSLFAARRIVELNLSGTPDEPGRKVLQKLAAQPQPDTLLIVICGALDYRQKSASWFLALEQAGASIYAWPVKPPELPGWIAERARAAGLELDADAVRELAARTEGNLLAAAQDIAKLKLLFPQGLVSAEQLAQAVADSARYEAFDLNDRILCGDAAGAVRSLGRMREEGVEVMEILGALLWSLRQWAQAQVFYAQSGDAARACEMARVPRLRQAGLLRALPRTRLPQIYGWLRRCALIDSAAKSTNGKEQAWEELLTLALAASGAATRKIQT